MKKINFIAQFPPPIHGLSLAVETLYNSEIVNQFELEKIDIKDNKKFLVSVLKILKSNADLFYFTISQTKGGNLRDLIILKILHMKHKKCIVHLHGGYYRKLVDNDLPAWQKKLNYKYISKIDGAIVLGKSLKYIFEGMVNKDKIFVVPNFVDDSCIIDDDKFSQKLKNLKYKSVFHVLYLSNFIKSKGYLEVLKMAKCEKLYCEKGNKKFLHFDFAGNFFDEKDKKLFFDYIEKNELQEYVTYHGVVKGQKKADLLSNCDIFVLLTRYPNEGQPISIIEAMANGLTVITTDHAGIPDLTENTKNFVVRKNKKMTFKDLRNLANNDFLELNAKENRKIVLKYFLQEHYIMNMADVFEKVIEC